MSLGTVRSSLLFVLHVSALEMGHRGGSAARRQWRRWVGMLPVAILVGLGWVSPGRPIRQAVMIEPHTYFGR
jgi:hypothetical protein